MKRYIKSAVGSVIDEPTDIQLALASDPDTSPLFLDQLADADSMEVLARVSKNPSTAPSTLNKLADVAVRTNDYRIGIPLAENPNTPEEGLIKLIDYDSRARAVMEPIIEHPNTTPRVLMALLKKDDNYVGYFDEITRHYKLSPEFLQELVDIPSGKHRRDVANYEYTPVPLLLELTQDSDRWVSADAMRNPRLTETDVRNIYSETSAPHIIKNPNCPSDILEQVAKQYLDKNNRWGLQTIAAHPNTPDNVLYEIYESGESNSWQSCYSDLARNPNIPRDLALQLSVCDNYHARERLAANPNVDPDILGSMVKDKIEIRKALAKNPSTPPKALLKLAKDRSKSILWEVAENPSLPEEAFDLLLDRVPDWILDNNPTYADRFKKD